MTVFYYHITSAQRAAALTQYRTERAAAHKAATAFAQSFAGEGQTVEVRLYKETGAFYGAQFTPAMDIASWTVPDNKHGQQRPRSVMAGRGITAEQKQAQAALLARWVPPTTECMSATTLYDRLAGIALDGMTSASCFECADGSVMLSTSQASCASSTDGVTEVLASVFDAAQRAFYAAAGGASA